ncbi:MAG: tyrosine-type recombinase/integrase [Algibacter sp.]|uniref:phage integrase SAM-like domain-containing protein n=1 Tax=Algibacter sp. TaxID=1872428 RepID=UPI0026065380|nr:phage integrase SAM-like domain-containing protein [Algibacter sp.]MDG1729949.1 tyrosine-type recombinase/integrase [Algibacter sp.]
MASIKIVLRKNMIKKDNTIPLAIRISANYKTSYKWLGQYVLEKDWDEINGKVKRTHPNSKKLNNFLLKKLTETNDIYFDSKRKITPKQVKQKLKGPGGSTSFFDLAVKRVQDKYDEKVFSVAKSELSILYNLDEFLSFKNNASKEAIISKIKKNRLERISAGRKGELLFEDSINKFKKNKKLMFQDITPGFLEKFKSFCSVYLGQKTRTVTNQLIFVRTLFNIAVRDGIIDAQFYPFNDDKSKIKIGTSHKVGLNIQEVEKIEALSLDYNSSIWHTRNVWLIAFYFAGIRISDVVKLKWINFKDDRLLYVMNKNEKPLSLKVPDKATKILSMYKIMRTENKGFVFPFLKESNLFNEEDVFKKTRNATKLLNKYLKIIAIDCNIEKNLSNHIARHSFGNIAGDTIHPLMLQKLYRHSDLKTTLNYQANFIHRDADEALDNVINF